MSGQNLISDIIEELKRLQVEIGKDLPVVKIYTSGLGPEEIDNAWPIYNKEKNRIEF